jgi:hypothetical protein
MSEIDAKKQALLLQACEIVKAAATESRPSVNLRAWQLTRSLRTTYVDAEQRAKIQGGSVDLYNRVKVGCAIDSLHAGAIVALNNAIMDAFGEAAWGGRTRDENLGRALEGIALLIELMNAFETRRDLRKHDDPALRANRLEAVLKQLDCDKEQPLETPQVPRVSCKIDDPETA